jgi:alanine racemase
MAEIATQHPVRLLSGTRPASVNVMLFCFFCLLCSVHTQYPISKLAQMCGGEFYPRFDADAIVSYLLTDSRKLRHANEALFFAIKSKRQDGHTFIPYLIEQGVRNFVVTDETVVAKYAQANFIVVKDTILALQKMATLHRKQFSYPVVGITGSNGKTICKEWLYQLLNEDFNIVRNPKSFNSQIGVPVSVWNMTADNTLGLFEAGISEPDEMLRLQKVIQPTIGLITNIGEAHSEGFLNAKHKTKEKLKLFADAEIIVYCKDHGDINNAIGEINSFNKAIDDSQKLKTFSWSSHADSDFRVVSILQKNNKSFISALYHEKEFDFEIPFSDKASVENAIHCVCVMLVLGVDMDVIRARMDRLVGVAMRLEMKEAVNNCTVINDAYNSDLESIRIALDFLSQQHQHAKRTIILSDVHQSGRNDPDLYQLVAAMLKEHHIDRLIGVGRNIVRQKKYFEEAGVKEIFFFESTDDLLKATSGDWFKNETILLKGARIFEFERILKILERKSHRTVMEINLNALIQNLKVYQEFLKPQTRVMAMVKAFSYGSGSFEIANILQFNNVDYLAVAYADEGVELRKNGIVLPIMVMNPEEAAFDQIFSFKLEPDIYSLRLLDEFILAVKENGVEDVRIHLEIETGMNRLGFTEAELEIALEKIALYPAIKIASVFTHLAASEDQSLDAFTDQQVEIFERASSKVIRQFDYKIIRHCLNSTGITRHAKYQYDMVRLGVGLYGVDSSLVIQNKLLPVSTLKTTISQIKKVEAGESVGYGRIGVVNQPKTIATIGIGYADGLSRRLSNGAGFMRVNGKLAPVIGNICMDMTMLDVSDISNAEEGDEVIVFGADPTVQNLAKAIGTIPYEILTGVGGRVKRVYLQE